jgi:glycosyltransferase involved in cell wall biosynthesis
VLVITPGEPDEWVDGNVRVLQGRAETRLALVRGLRRWTAEVDGIVARLRPDIVHGHGLPLGGIGAVGGKHSARRIVTVHGNPLEVGTLTTGDPATRVRRRLRMTLARAAARRADAIISVHPDWRVNVPIQAERFAYIPNIVDRSYFETTRKPMKGRVLYCGGARRIKGWDVLGEAWREVARVLPNAHLELVGWPEEGGPSLPNPMATTVRGWLSMDQERAAVARCEVLVIPSRYEVAPVVLGEAWALRTAIVATSVGGIPGLAQGAAVLVPSEDPAALARALVDVLTGRIDTGDLIAEGRRRAEPYKVERVVAAHLELYRSLLRGRSKV